MLRDCREMSKYLILANITVFPYFNQHFMVYSFGNKSAFC